ncbi:hypothetical protein DR64_2210 [Paraburkholderia xenovorans LB400]|nr:hypothetical protein DR64_2210 [Paraburkholderia xenovorans LB400]
MQQTSIFACASGHNGRCRVSGDRCALIDSLAHDFDKGERRKGRRSHRMSALEKDSFCFHIARQAAPCFVNLSYRADTANWTLDALQARCDSDGRCAVLDLRRRRIDISAILIMCGGVYLGIHQISIADLFLNLLQATLCAFAGPASTTKAAPQRLLSSTPIARQQLAICTEPHRKTLTPLTFTAPVRQWRCRAIAPECLPVRPDRRSRPAPARAHVGRV